MTRLSPLPEEIEDRPFAQDEEMYARLSRSRLAARDLHRPSRGIRVPTSSPTDLAALVRSHTRLDPDTFGSLITAAEILGIPLPPWAEFQPDDGGPVTAAVSPPPWGKKSGAHFREPGRRRPSPDAGTAGTGRLQGPVGCRSRLAAGEDQPDRPTTRLGVGCVARQPGAA